MKPVTTKLGKHDVSERLTLPRIPISYFKLFIYASTRFDALGVLITSFREITIMTH